MMLSKKELSHKWLPVQALALLQWRAGRLEEAREIFQEAVTNCPPHAPLWAAWASCEVCTLPNVMKVIYR